ncbi:conserved hypothetical protein [Uncinocarpus reesii 1704]|uniref:Uncharacterized protein n=1 Tax=Uncinocarpus reesii (strain UAMH 1704) TaxID=336963 RepID=C4JGB5_UNCRE|nr:uncharacterized protein UREG_02513 [Uncinocarpus reesii 1704]EEP77664.1 conserved hypothetical protein [Uncinocarpus reesii 1704]
MDYFIDILHYGHTSKQLDICTHSASSRVITEKPAHGIGDVRLGALDMIIPPSPGTTPMAMTLAPPTRMAMATRSLLIMMTALMLPQEIRKHCRKKERYRIQNPKRKRGLEHRADLLRVAAERVIRPATPNAKGAQAQEEAAAAEVVAVFVDDAAEEIDAGDEGAEETEVDEGDEDGGALGAAVADEGLKGPCAG